jgi:hypothetical protein
MRLKAVRAARPVTAVSRSRAAIEAVRSKRDFDPMFYRVVGGAQEKNTQWWVSKWEAFSGEIKV